jgi:hypothetical protein
MWLFLGSMRRLLVTANVVPSSPIPVTLMTATLCSSETSVLSIHHAISTSALHGGEWPASHSSRFTSEEAAPVNI